MELTMKGLETRKTILEAATLLVAKKGIENASVTEVSKKAKVSRTLVPYYIPKQDKLLIELIHFVVQQAYQYFETHGGAIKCSTRLPEAIEKRVRLNFDFFLAHPHYFQCMMLFYYRCSYDLECRKLNTQLTQAVVSSFAKSLKNKNVARLLYRQMYSSIQELFILDKNPPDSLNKVVKQTLDEMLDLL